MISDVAFYNLDPKRFSFKRRAEIKNISSIALSPFCDGYIVIHMKEPDYDYIALCDKKTEVVTVLQSCFNKINGANLAITFSDRIEFRSRKGKREVTFSHGPKDTANKKGKALLISVDSSNTASPGDFASIIEYTKLKTSKSQPAPHMAIIRKEKNTNQPPPRVIPSAGFGAKQEERRPISSSNAPPVQSPSSTPNLQVANQPAKRVTGSNPPPPIGSKPTPPTYPKPNAPPSQPAKVTASPSIPVTSNNAKFCKACGVVASGGKFCSNCGQPL
jgi:hypothetical protein